MVAVFSVLEFSGLDP